MFIKCNESLINTVVAVERMKSINEANRNRQRRILPPPTPFEIGKNTGFMQSAQSLAFNDLLTLSASHHKASAPAKHVVQSADDTPSPEDSAKAPVPKSSHTIDAESTEGIMVDTEKGGT